jgi:hypothetical protein
MTRRFVVRSYERRRSPPMTSVVIFASIGAVLVVYGLVVGFVIKPPPLRWIGFVIVSTVVLGLAALAPLAFERTRVSALRPAAAVDRQTRLLMVADSHRNESALCDEIFARFGDAAVVHVVVPVRVSHLHFVTDDENRERREARQSMLHTVALLQARVARDARSDRNLRRQLELSEEAWADLDDEAQRVVDASLEFAKDATEPSPSDALKYVYAPTLATKAPTGAEGRKR